MEVDRGFSLGLHDVHPPEGCIVMQGGAHRLEPKAMAVLVELARWAPYVCSRQRLEHAVWPRGHVTEDALTRCIGQLRRALRGSGDAWIETVPRRGYRLCVAPGPLHAAAPPPPPAADGGSPGLIVMPWRTRAGSEAGLVGEGLATLLAQRLASLPGLHVISGATAARLAAQKASVGRIAGSTGAAWVVTGSVLLADGRLQVLTELVDTRRDAVAWADQRGCAQDAILPMLQTLADGLAQALGARLALVATPPRLPLASLCDYLHARRLVGRRTPADLSAAADTLDRLLAGSADFAPAWAARAECALLLAHYAGGDPTPQLAACRQALQRALALDAANAVAWSVRGGLRLFFERDLDGAAADLHRAIEIKPNHALAMVTLANVAAVRWQFDAAQAWLGQALRIDPLDLGVTMNLGDHLILQRRPAEAAQALRRALVLDPEHEPSRLRLAWALALAGQADAARQALDESAARRGRVPPSPAWHEAAALVEGALGDHVRADRHAVALSALGAGVGPWSLARAHAAAGHSEAALDHLEAAWRLGVSSCVFARVTPALASLHGHPAFERRVAGLPAPPAGEFSRQVKVEAPPPPVAAVTAADPAPTPRRPRAGRRPRTPHRRR